MPKKNKNNSQNHWQTIRARQGKRLKLLGVVFCLCLVGLWGVAAYLVYTKGEEYSSAAVRQQIVSRSSGDRVTRPNRGYIYDRNNKSLAESTRVYNVILDVTVLDSREPNLEEPENDIKTRTLQTLNEVLGVPLEELQALFAKDAEGNLLRPTKYHIVQRQVSATDAAAIKQRQLLDIYLEDDTQRKYVDPYLAPQTIGFMRGDAAWGLEGYYNTELLGEEGRVFRTYDLENNPKLEEIPARNGYSLITTLDAEIQRIAQSIADKAYANTPCEFTGVLVMDPYTAEIIAMAQCSSFSLENPDDPALFTDASINTIWEALSAEEQLNQKYKMWSNYSTNRTFEPGSIFKPIVVAAALEENIINAQTSSFFCDGGERFAGHPDPIPCWYALGHGGQSVADVLANSCNDGMFEIVKQLGRELFYKYQRDFGIGERTGIDFPGEVDAASLIYSIPELNPVELATGAMGQGFNCTAIQAITAFSAVINGGNLMKPYLVSQIVDEQGNMVKETTPEVIRKVISTETSDFMRSTLHRIVSPNGTGEAAMIEGYTIGGKTGSAQQDADRQGMTLNFMAFTPVDEPEYIALVVLDHVEDTTLTSSDGVSPMIKDLLWQIIQYKNMPPADETDAVSAIVENEDQRTVLIDYSGMSLVEVTHHLNNYGIDYQVSGSGTVVKSHIPPAGQVAPKDRPIYLQLDPESVAEEAMTYVPDVEGLGMAQAEQYILEALLTPISIIDNRQETGEGAADGSSGPATYNPINGSAGDTEGEEEGGAELGEDTQPAEDTYFVYKQYPAAGSYVPKGTEIRLKVEPAE